MPMAHDLDLHGPILWPMPHPGVWLRCADRADRETFWRLDNAELHATAYVREAPAEDHAPFRVDTGREVVWLDVADPAGHQRLFSLDGDGRMSPLEQVRTRP